MTIAHCGRDVPFFKCSILVCSQVLTAISLEPTIICCAGGSVDFNKMLNKAPGQEAEIQHPFNLLPLRLRNSCPGRVLV